MKKAFSFNLLFLLLILSFSFGAFSAAKVELSSDERGEIVKIVRQLFNAGWEEKSKGEHKVKSPTMHKGMFEIIDGLYSDGYIRPEKLQTYYNAYLAKESSQPSGDNFFNKVEWEALYVGYIAWVLNDIKNNPQYCANSGEVATARQCCGDNPITEDDDNLKDEEDGIVKRAIPGFDPSLWGVAPSCNTAGASCSSHSDCCSSLCNKMDSTDPNSVGSCSQPMSCYSLVEYKQECNFKTSPYCKTISSNYHPGLDFSSVSNFIQSISQNIGSNNIPVACQQINHESTGVSECKSVSNSCSSDTDCCSDKCKSGKCVESSKCLICIQNGNKTIDQSGKSLGFECCPGTYESLDKRCIPKFPPYSLPQVKIEKEKPSILKLILNNLFPVAYAADGVCSSFTVDQLNKIKEQNKQCMMMGVQKEMDTCLAGLEQQKKLYMQENFTTVEPEIKAETAKCNAITDDKDREKCRVENVAPLTNGCTFELTREEYIAAYNVPPINSMTFSDPKRCDFNSYKDNWRDASALERNAELVLRGYEYVYSGHGAQDFWVEQGKQQNIYERAQSVAKRIRDNRVSLIRKMQALDYQMTCDCVKIKKTQGVSPQALDIFNTSPICEQARAEYNNTTGSSNESKIADSDEIDAGASGISHEKLLIEFTKRRAEIQIDRFTDNSQLEAELDELSQFIQNNDWYQGTEKTEHLYKFEVRYMSGWFKFLLTVVAVAAITAVMLIFPAAGVAVLSTLTASQVAVLSLIFLTGGIASLSAGKVKPHVGDIVRVYKGGSDQSKNYNAQARKDNGNGRYLWRKGKAVNWLATHRKFIIDRYYIYPYYKSNSTNHKCEINASSNLCMRNVYQTVFQDNLRYLIDVKTPLFVDPTAYKDDTEFINKLNAQYTTLIDRLKATKPNGRTGKRFLSEDIMMRKEIQEAMMPMNGTYLPEVFDENKIKAVLAGVKKYSTCKDLIGNTEGSACRVILEGSNFLDGVEDAAGFGYLFESEEDINNFAEYVYQHHFHWPSITASNRLGYPLLAQSAYFQTIAYNLKLVGSLAASRGIGYGDAWSMYEADWSKRLADYDCNNENYSGVCAQAKAGDASANVKYSKEFFAKFKTLNFATGEIPEGFSAKDGSITGGNFNKAETAALSAGVSKAMRAAEAKKVSDHYNKVVASTERGKAISTAKDAWSNTFNAPLNQMKMNVGGENFGAGSSYNAASGSIANSSDNKKANKNSNAFASYKPTDIDYGSQYQNYNSGTNNGSSSSTGNASNKTKQGLSEDTNMLNNFLLDSASKNGEAYARDDSDSIFRIVSKAYYRNLGLILERSTSLKEVDSASKTNLEFKPKDSTLSNDKKSELKKLLSN